MDIELLRSFVPEETPFGTDYLCSNGKWDDSDSCFQYTFFKTKEQLVQVVFSFNEEYDCMELVFMTAQLNIIGAPLGFNRPDLPVDPNRGTHMFRMVTHVIYNKLPQFKRIVFYGANEYLDRIYTMVARLPYVQKQLFEKDFFAYQVGKFIFFESF